MKKFEDICRMTQSEVKNYMQDYLLSKKYKVVNEDGFLYAKGTVPVLLVAHMDTVHNEQCKSIINLNGKMSSPQGIGGDDRCGVFMIMNVVKELNCSVLLCEDEEKGGVGARKFVNAKIKQANEKGESTEIAYINQLDVNFMIEFDRKGSNDAVFYSCDNKDFINFVTDVAGFKFAYGSFSDISVLMPAAKLSAVNLSCGYYNAHTVNEYVVYDEMMDAIEAAKLLIKENVEKPFEYIAKKYELPKYNHHSSSDVQRYYHDGDSYYGSIFDMPSESVEERAQMAANDTELELEVIIYDEMLSEKALYATGKTKAECWMAMFLENPNLCFNDITDYSWC